MKTVISHPRNRITHAWDFIEQSTVKAAPPGSRLTYGGDAIQRISRLVHPKENRTTYTYAAGRRATKILANGTRDARQHRRYNGARQPSTHGSYPSRYDFTATRYAAVKARRQPDNLDFELNAS